VFYHHGPGHEPLETENSATILQFTGGRQTLERAVKAGLATR
jgi:hypothetical protein